MASVKTATPARVAALKVLRAVRERGAYVQDVLAVQVDNNHGLSVQDRAFATLLSIGVVQTQGTLDELINLTLKNPHDIKANVRDALRLPVYEMIFLKKAPHAAVSQGVELVRSVAPKASKLANFVLRRVADQSRTFPFGDPVSSLAPAARLNGFPYWLAELLEAELGPNAARSFMAASNEPAPLFLALNACKAKAQTVEKVLMQAGESLQKVTLAATGHAPCYKVSDARVLLIPSVKQLVDQGKLIVADAASQSVMANILPDTLPQAVLEVGAGRGTKTLLAQSNAVEKYGRQISHYATLDNLAFKTKLLRQRAKLGYCKLEDALTGDATDCGTTLGTKQFDFIFIDAPCSGLGTLRRHPEIRWRISPKDITNLAQTQLAMLKSCAAHVCKGGVLAYATCTVTTQENAQVVKAFLSCEEGKAFELAPIGGKPCLQTRLAHGASDAHFAVRFLRVR